MPKMTAAQAGVHVLRKEGVNTAFGVPGAAINPLYAALRAIGGVNITSRATSRARRTWPRAIRARKPATSASASAPRGRRAPT